MLSKQCWILKYLQFFVWKNCKNLRIQHFLESKKLKFFNLQVRNEKKIGGYFLKKMHFCKIFSVPARSICFSSGAQNIYLGAPFAMVGKKNRDWRKKVTNFLYALLQWLLLINHWVLSPYLGTTKTGLSRAFWNGMAIGKSPKNEVSRDKSLKQHILQSYKWKSKFFKILLLWTTLMEFLGSEGMSEGNSPFSSKIFDKNFFTQLNFWRMHHLHICEDTSVQIHLKIHL